MSVTVSPTEAIIRSSYCLIHTSWWTPKNTGLGRDHSLELTNLVDIRIIEKIWVMGYHRYGLRRRRLYQCHLLPTLSHHSLPCVIFRICVLTPLSCLASGMLVCLDPDKFGDNHRIICSAFRIEWEWGFFLGLRSVTYVLAQLPLKAL